ncbi:hypothetical protein PYL79_21960, partial [Paenibacillus larvae subsp. larvae]
MSPEFGIDSKRNYGGLPRGRASVPAEPGTAICGKTPRNSGDLKCFQAFSVTLSQRFRAAVA